MKNYFLSALLCVISTFAFGQGSSLDERAKKHYSQEQISSMSPVKIAQINFYYRSSFEVKKGDKICTACTEINPETFDITKFENQRSEDKRVVVFASSPGWPIILLSTKELQAEYKRIEQSFSANNQ